MHAEPIDPVDSELQAEQAIARSKMHERAGMELRWPLTSSQAAHLLRAGGEYDVDAATLDGLVHRRRIPRPGVDENNRFEWGANDLLTAIGCLTEREQWLPDSGLHHGQKHPLRLLLEQARREGCLRDVVDDPARPKLDLRDLLAALRGAETFEARTRLTLLLEATLETEHGIRL